jgi:hypothetical protein
MTYPVSKLITNAYYLSGLVAQGFETVSGPQMAAGLDLLNVCLTDKAADLTLIPYFKEFDLTGVVGQELYFIPNLLSIETFVFYINNVRMPTQPTNRRNYFGSSRVDGINSLPFTWFPERAVGGMNLYVYFPPAQAYPFVIHGKFGFTQAGQFDDLSTTYDAFYINYLKYALAFFICNDNQLSFPPDCLKKLRSYEKTLKDVSQPDLTISKVSSFSGGVGINWALVNFPGWVP